MAKISIKTPQEIAIMAEGGGALAQILTEVLSKIEPGVSTGEIDAWIDKGIADFGGKAAFKEVPNYHWASCVGLNDEVVHSIPRKDRRLKNGDLLKIDLGMLWQGFNTDLSWTVIVGGEKEEAKEKFLAAGKKALSEAIKVARAGNRVGDISETIQTTIENAGYFPVRVLTGHGIGRQLHEDPLIPGILTGKKEKTPQLLPGMTLAIEVIYSLGTGEVVLASDGWTILTKDGKISGLFEKTIAITENEPLVLTPLSGA